MRVTSRVFVYGMLIKNFSKYLFAVKNQMKQVGMSA